MKIINLDPNCMKEDTVTHEILHALGFFHHQSRWGGQAEKYFYFIQNIFSLFRPDRDEYVQVNWDNIIDGKKGNY